MNRPKAAVRFFPVVREGRNSYLVRWNDLLLTVNITYIWCRYEYQGVAALKENALNVHVRLVNVTQVVSFYGVLTTILRRPLKIPSKSFTPRSRNPQKDWLPVWYLVRLVR
jgi:hypothetical protein